MTQPTPEVKIVFGNFMFYAFKKKVLFLLVEYKNVHLSVLLPTSAKLLGV